MAVFNNLGDTIEGEAVDFDGRAIRSQGAKKHPLTKKTMKLFTTDRNSHAVVRKAGVEPVDEDVKAATAHFHRDVDDKVTADIQSMANPSGRKLESHTRTLMEGGSCPESITSAQYRGRFGGGGCFL